MEDFFMRDSYWAARQCVLSEFSFPFRSEEDMSWPMMCYSENHVSMEALGALAGDMTQLR
jgi:hypothetical protein